MNAPTRPVLRYHGGKFRMASWVISHFGGHRVYVEPTHAPGGANGKLPWRAAREIIDFSLPSPSVYERERPLSAKTMARIYAGLRKFGLKPFIVPGKNENPRDKQMRGHSLEHPLPTVTATGHLDLVEPFILPQQTGEDRARSVDRPLQTVTTESRGIGLVQPFIVSWDNQSSKTGERSADEPLSTITTKARHGVAQPYLVKLRGTNDAADVDAPAPTVTANGNHLGLAEPFLVQVAHGNDDATGDERRSRPVEEPLPTVCGSREWALCEPGLLPQQSGGQVRPVSPTVATDGAIALVEPFLIEYYGQGGAQSIDDPLNTVTTKHRHGLVRPVVVIEGKRYLLDIGFRMLQPRELASAQGFPGDYQFTGNKTEQVKQIGNAVPCGLAGALVEAVLRQ